MTKVSLSIATCPVQFQRGLKYIKEYVAVSTQQCAVDSLLSQIECLPEDARMTHSPRSIKYQPKRLKRAALVIFVLGVSSAAQTHSAWLVSDRTAQGRLNDIKSNTRNIERDTGKITDQLTTTNKNLAQIEVESKGIRADMKPNWSGSGLGTSRGYDLVGSTTTYDTLATVGTRSPTHNMEARCGVDKTFVGDDLWEFNEVDSLLATVGAKHLDLCQRIVAAENARFNQVIKGMKRVKERNDELLEIGRYRASINDMGQLAVSSHSLDMLMADAQVEDQYTKATIAAYDSLIASLKQSQSLVGDEIINGEQSLVASGIRMAALEAAIRASAIIP
jgi:hypothetical protein